jgi:Leucine-rich repeat (LRR) protein
LIALTEGFIRDSMLVECCKTLTRLRSCRVLSAAANLQNTATSLGQAVRQGDTVDVLDLQESADLLCVNLMCEKVGDPCICRLSRVLEKLHQLTRLNLANNQLISLPESIGQLEQLQYLDLSNNRLQSLPDTMQQLRQLKVCHRDRMMRLHSCCLVI